MLTPASLAFLKRLLDTPGPSGFETAPARVWREEAKSFGAEVIADVSGNSMATINPNSEVLVDRMVSQETDAAFDALGLPADRIDRLKEQGLI